MDNSEQLLMITISNKNKNDECKIQLSEVKSIEKIKEDYKQKLGFENIDINKINFYFIDDNEDKNIINEFNDLIEFASSQNNNLSIKLFAEINEEKNNIMDKQDKEKDNNNNFENINNNNENRNKTIDDYKDRLINKLNAEIEKLKIKCNKYKNKIKNIIDDYEKKISELSKVNSKKENEELFYENNNINNKSQNENNIKTEENILYRQNIQFISNKCNNCSKQNEKNIFQCISCETYYLCQACHKENFKNNKYHKHKYFFDIVFPVELMTKIKAKEKHDKEYYDATNNFNDFLNGIFFDKSGKFSKEKYIPNKSNIKKFNNLCNEMKKFKEDPLKYFEEYKTKNINPKLEEIKNEENQEKPNEIIISINEKLNLFSNNNSFKFS